MSAEIVIPRTLFDRMWDCFCTGQMSATQLLEHVKADERFSAYCVEKCQEVRARQAREHEDDGS